MRQLIGVFGGTFDPLHCGHLRTMLELHEELSLDRLLVVPCGTPPHRAPTAAPADARLAMLKTALEGFDGFEVDERELHRDGPSWTVDTLASLRADEPDAALCLLLGSDAFVALPSWHRWSELPELAHIVVARRPGVELLLPEALQPTVRARRAEAAALRDAPAGSIVFCETSQLHVSSSRIRELAAARRSLRWLVPDPVERLIEEKGWYRTGN